MARNLFSPWSRPTRSKSNARRRGRKRGTSSIRHATDLRVEPLEDRRMLSAGDLDLTFSVDGLVLDDFGLGKDEEILAAAVQEDGKIVVGGFLNTPNTATRDFMVARYNADGTRDTTFGPNNDGIFTLDVSGVALDDRVNDVVIDPLGRIIAVGSAAISGTTSAIAVVRLTPDGQLDTTFDGDGIATTVLESSPGQSVNSLGLAAALDGNSKLVVGGTTTPVVSPFRDFAVVRYNTDGSLDTSFGGNGYVLTDFNTTVDNLAEIAIQSDGKIVAVGDSRPNASSANDFALARYNTDGSLDTTFDSDGLVTTDITPGAFRSQDFATSVAIEADGQIVVAGLTINQPGSLSALNRDYVVARYNSSGALDTTFNPTPSLASQAGTLRIDFASNFDVQGGLALQPDAAGNYLVSGARRSNTVGTDYRFGVARVLSGGLTPGDLDTTLDPSGATGDSGPASNGQLLTVLAGTDFMAVTEVLVQPDGRILVVGHAMSTSVGGNIDVAMARYDSGLGPAPIADAGGPYGPLDENGGTFELDSTGSTVTGIPFTWDLDGDGIYGETGGAALYGDEVGPSPTFLATNLEGASTLTVKLKVTNGNGLFHVDTATVDVLNVAPTAVLANDGPVNEGSTANVSFSSQFDPSTADTTAGFRYAYDFDNDGTFDLGDGTYAGSVASASEAVPSSFLNDGPASFTIRARIIDKDGGFNDYTTDVDVLNVAPTAALANDGPVNEGSTANVSFSSQLDPSTADTTAGFRYAYDFDNDGTFDLGDGTYAGSVASASEAVPGSFLDDGPASFTIRARIIDKDGGFNDYTTDVDVLNVAPTLTISGAANVDEGALYTLNLSSSDPGDDTITQWTINWGDTIEVVAGDPASVNHTYADGDANYVIIATATDEDGTFAAGNTVAVMVDNVAPTADAGGPYFTFDDTPITLTGSGSDPAGALDPLTFVWDLDDDGIFGETGAAAARGDEVGASPVFDPTGLTTGSYTVTLRVSDDDGGVTDDTAQIDVLSVGTLLIDGTLYIIGSDTENDHVFVKKFNGEIKVFATFNDSNPVVFDANDVVDIQVRTRGGNDQVIISHSVDIGATIDGGSGNDVLLGGSGDDLIIGGAGNDLMAGQAGNDMLLAGDGQDDLFGGSGDDVLVGGDADDLLFGGSGRDLMIGGQDNDWLFGGSGDDILIGGYTVHDNDTAALDAVMAIWTSSDSFNQRVATLTGSGGLLEAGVAVFDDDDSDVLIGGSGRDLLFADITWAGGDKDFVLFSHQYDHLEVTN